MKTNSNLFFEVLSTKLRWRILELLKEKERTVNEISKEVKEDQSKVSHNLKKLRDCHFINVEKKGKERVYSLNKDTIVPLLNLVDKHIKKYCCKSCPMKCGEKK